MGERREPEHALAKTLWRGFPGINGLKIQGSFEGPVECFGIFQGKL